MKSKFYAVCGQGQSHVVTRRGVTIDSRIWDHTGVIEVVEETVDEAIRAAKKYFGSNWSMVYNWREIDLLNYNEGVIARLEDDEITFPVYTYAVYSSPSQCLGADGEPAEDPALIFSSPNIIDLVPLYNDRKDHKIRIYECTEDTSSQRPGSANVPGSDGIDELPEIPIETPQSETPKSIVSVEEESW